MSAPDHPHPISLTQKLALFSDHWAPRIIGQLNDYHLKLAKLHGDFVWHAHPETDELFLVIEGHLRIELRDGAVDLGPGELVVIPRGVEHRPRAREECHVLLVEPAGTINTGDAQGDVAADPGVWI